MNTLTFGAIKMYLTEGSYNDYFINIEVIGTYHGEDNELGFELSKNELTELISYLILKRNDD